jgi:hypothetical protein
MRLPAVVLSRVSGHVFPSTTACITTVDSVTPQTHRLQLGTTMCGCSLPSLAMHPLQWRKKCKNFVLQVPMFGTSPQMMKQKLQWESILLTPAPVALQRNKVFAKAVPLLDA